MPMLYHQYGVLVILINVANHTIPVTTATTINEVASCVHHECDLPTP